MIQHGMIWRGRARHGFTDACALRKTYKPMKYDVIASLKEKGLVKSGDSIILTYGDEMEKVGATNTLKIVEVE